MPGVRCPSRGRLLQTQGDPRNSESLKTNNANDTSTLTVTVGLSAVGRIDTTVIGNILDASISGVLHGPMGTDSTF